MDYRIDEFIIENVNDVCNDYGDDYLNKLTYKIIGAAMDVHNTLGKGFLEAVYKDCICIEFDNKGISYEREKKYDIIYKGKKIPRHYCADFTIEGSVILDVKSQNNVIDENLKQIINYLAISKCKIGLLINFGENSLKFKRVILTNN